VIVKKRWQNKNQLGTSWEIAEATMCVVWVGDVEKVEGSMEE